MEKNDLWNGNYLDMLKNWSTEEESEEKQVTEDIKQEPTTNKTPDVSENKRFVILAYIKPRSQRQLYISGWNDEEDAWEISAVPYPTTYKRCEHLLNLAKQEIEKSDVEGTWLRKYPAGMDLRIVEFDDPHSRKVQ